MRYGMMFAARNVLGKQIGSLYPEIYDEEDEEDEEEDEEQDEDVWTRYEGQEDDMALQMNQCADSWNEWEPDTPAETMLKKAIDKQLGDVTGPDL
jgi:hypothetical protein